VDSGWWTKKEKRVDVPSFFFGFCPYLYATISHFIVIFLGGFNFFSYLCSEITICCELCLKAMMDTKEIGIIIKERRKHLGVNQQTLADLAGVGLNTLVAIERGEGNPQLSTLLTILDTLGLQMDIKLKTLDYETV